MGACLADRLDVTRHRLFVGRAAERASFQAALAAAELPFHMLHIFGPGGVGKTTLLGEFVHLCNQTQTPATYIDARDVEPSPESFAHSLRTAMGLAADDSPLHFLASHSHRHVILIDTYERLAPLDRWLRETFFPQLPATVLLVLAGRSAPSAAWRADPGWQELVHTIALRNLSPSESKTFLTRRAVPTGQHESVLAFTHGHPLALSLVADAFDQRPDLRFQPTATPGVLKALLEQFLQNVPGLAHRAALEACALVHLTTESLLGSMLNLPGSSTGAGYGVYELFEWLRGLSFIEAGPLGLYPHDLAREVLAADLRWRNPDWYAELHRRARNYYATRLQDTRGPEQQRILFDYVFLHRDNPVVRPFFEWQSSGSMLTDAMRDDDVEALVAMVSEYEGNGSALLASHWFARQPAGVLVLRGGVGQTSLARQPAGFVAMVSLHQAKPEEVQADPAAMAAWTYLERHTPLRPGERATLFRFWMARDSYQAVSPAQSLIFINVVRHYLTTPRLAFTFFPCAEPDFWAPVFAYADLARLPEADFEVAGRRYGMYGHDWRAMPPMRWLALLAEREVATTPQTMPPPQVSAPLVVLSQSEFAVAVRDALRGFSRPDALLSNPLLRSRLVTEQIGDNAGESERVATLQALVKEAAEALQSTAREMKFYRALHHTYFQPALTQEKAAELLDVPFSTFRRHLTAGIERVTDLLWQREMGVLNQ